MTLDLQFLMHTCRRLLALVPTGYESMSGMIERGVVAFCMEHPAVHPQDVLRPSDESWQEERCRVAEQALRKQLGISEDLDRIDLFLGDLALIA
jgi:hypothetical protein